MQFNSDTGNNYDTASVENNGSSGSGFSATGIAYISIDDMVLSTDTAGFAGIAVATIPSYRSTTFWKAVVSQSSRPGTTNRAALRQGIWKSTAAITRIDLTAENNSFLAGSNFYLYGIT